MLHGVPKNEPRRAEDDPKRGQRRPKTTRRRTQEGQKSDPESQDEKKDRTKTIPRPSWTAHRPICRAQPPPRGSIWEAKTAPKSIPKRSKIEVKIQESTKTDPRRSWTRLGAILGRLGRHLGALETLWHYACRCFVNIHFFDVKTVRRRSWDQLWPTKAPKRPKMTPKTEPKSTPRRSKIDINIDMKNDAKTKRAGQVLARRHWAGTPPQGAPGRRPRGPGEAAQAPQDRHPDTHARVLNIKRSKELND